MPFIRVTCPANALTAEQKAQLAPLLTDGVIRQEVDPVTENGKAATLLAFNDIDESNCFPGGTSLARHPENTFWIVETMVDAGFFNQARRDAVQAAIARAFVDVLGDDGSVIAQDGLRIAPAYLLHLYSLIVEIPEGSWGIGGRTVSAIDISKFIGTDQGGSRFAELRENTAKLEAARSS